VLDRDASPVEGGAALDFVASLGLSHTQRIVSMLQSIRHCEHLGEDGPTDACRKSSIVASRCFCSCPHVLTIIPPLTPAMGSAS
jgi:hypothetical protein